MKKERERVRESKNEEREREERESKAVDLHARTPPLSQSKQARYGSLFAA